MMRRTVDRTVNAPRVASIPYPLRFAFAAVLLSGVVAPRAGMGLSREDRTVVDFMIRELKYYDTARRWLNELKSEPRLSVDDRAEIDSRLIDILQAEGKQEEALSALEAFKKKYPQHPRATLGSLEAIGARYAEIVVTLEKAVVESDKKKAAELRAEASRLFQSEVRTALEALITNLAKKVQEAIENKPPADGGPSEPSQEELSKKRLLYQAELSRIKLLLNYSKLLPADSKERKDLLEEGLKYAQRFVDERYEFYVMQYDGQIQKGLYLVELGRQSDAFEELSILFDIAPPADPPYSPALVKAFKTIRLQAILFGARALNSAKEFQKAQELIESNVIRPTSTDPFALGDAEQIPELRQFAVLTRLEYGIAKAGAGDPEGGMEIIHGVIDKYKNDTALVIDARKALGRIAASSTAPLTGRDYKQAADGLKSELRLEEALVTYQKALATLDGSDVATYAPLCLNEIGEISYILSRYEESALAYEDLTSYFSSHSLAAKASQNFLAAVTKAQGQPGTTDHVGLTELRDRAQRAYDQLYGEGIAGEQAEFVDAQRMERNGRYREAREKYFKVRQEVDGTPIPFYWRAQASGWATYMREWQTTEPELRAHLAPELEKAVVELEKIIQSALAAESLDGAALAALTLGQIRYEREEWAEAVEVLQVFLSDLAENETYRCVALGYLVLAATAEGGGDLAEDAYKPLREHCKDDPALASAAYALSDYLTDEEEYGKAALYLLDYASHPSSEEELKDVDMVMKVAKVLADGGLTDQSRKFVEIAKGLPRGDDEVVEQELKLMDARLLQSQGNWKGVIQTLEAYVKDYGVKGDHPDDPKVRRDLAQAYLKVGGKSPSTANLLMADKHYNWVIYILNSWREKDPKQDRLFWRYAWEWMKVKYQLARSGHKDALGDIRVFLDRFREDDMGGEDLRENFRKLHALVTRLQNNDGGTGGKR